LTPLPKTKTKGQIFSTDFIIGTVTFLFVLIGSIYIWTHVIDQIQLSEERKDMIAMTYFLGSSLVETTGSPSNWTLLGNQSFNRTNIYSLGLARSKSLNRRDVLRKGVSGGLTNSSYLNLDSNKIQRLVELNNTKYDEMKRILGVTSNSGEFYVKISQWQDTEYVEVYTFGKLPPSFSAHIIKTDRYGTLGFKWAHVEISVWSPCHNLPC
jgi:hypothetical protein